MLSQKNRLPFAELNARGYQTIRTPYFSLKLRKNGLPQNRIGVVIGVAAEKSAVRRNFWKRQAKALLQKGSIARADAGIDFVVIFTKKIKELTADDFKRELSKIAANSK